ncbi:CDGSH iron-sulfur domain-containing protein [Pseudofrankia sp. DC12]|uniref:CDGSH iron-sulfur domain-containing protein n=1 Tax=Pseudofrankia sp. DC12 TaxID=683315 RepID=UPI0005F7F202
MTQDRLRATITVCTDGPLLVRGDFELRDLSTGRPVDARRAVIALCRCGRSEIKPFCDGSHVPPRRPPDRTVEPHSPQS